MSHRLEYALFRCVQGFLLLLPLKSVQRIGAALGAAAYGVASGRRRIALENLRLAFPEKSARELSVIARGAFQSYAITMLEFLWTPNMDPDTLRSLVSGRNVDVLSRCLQRGKGIVVISAHFGNWEACALALGVAYGMPVSIVVQTQNNRLVDAAINELRTAFGNKTVPMGIAVREVVRALDRKELVAFAADQSGPQEGPFAEFFGRIASTHQGPAVFALRKGAPAVLVLTVRRSDGTYDCIIEEIPTADLSGVTPENIQILTERHTKALEGYIRQYPEQWLWMHRRWKHLLPEGAGEITDGLNASKGSGG